MSGLKKRLLEDIEELEKLDLGKKHGGVSHSLIALKFEDGHSHIYYPADDDETHTFWKDISEEKKFEIKIKEVAREVIKDSNGQATYKKDRKIIFGHHRSAGDGLMFSAGIRDFKLLFPEIAINVDSNQDWIWENNPYLDRSLKKNDPEVEYYGVGYPAIASVNNTYVHFAQMFLLDMIAVSDLHYKLPISLGEFCAAFANGEIGDPDLGNSSKNPSVAKEPFISIRNKYRDFCEKFCRMRGDLHMTKEEKEFNLIKETYGIEKYWVIAPGGKRDGTAKIWDWRKFQDVIDHFEGRIKFVVIGASDLLVEKLDNVIDLTDKFPKLRGLVPLVYHAEGCVSGPSLLLHLAAAVPPKRGRVRKPCVGILGGREPTAWTWYCTHQILHMNAAYSCCESGGCWYGRIHPLPKDPENNKNLCRLPIKSDGRTVQSCMEVITADDVIRAIEKYYQGNLYTLANKEEVVDTSTTAYSSINYNVSTLSDVKQINLLGNLNSAGGGEQSLLMIAKTLRKHGWKVNLFPWGSVHENYIKEDFVASSFIKDRGELMASLMQPGFPLLFYGNDCVEDFVKYGQGIVDKSSGVIIGINYTLGHLKDPRLSSWLSKSQKLKAVIFQNEEKRNEWYKQVVGFDNTKTYVLFGAIDIDTFYETCIREKDKKEPLVVLKHCVSDYRKYVTEASHNKGDKIHLWQKNLDKELDIKFYKRLLANTKNINFEFMEAHEELEEAFKKENRMKFHKWDSMPVTEFLANGDVYLYRTSNLWRDQYPRVVAEALAVGLPVITEPRDGTKDRVIYGNTGFYFVDFDGCLYALKLLQRKDKYRKQMGMNAKDWAKKNLDPGRWVDVLEEICSSN